MKDDLISFAEKLQHKLKGPLPGDHAHRMMMPVGRNDEQRAFLEQQSINFKLGGVLILLFSYEGKISFPLTQRHDYPGVHSGQVSLPGGRKEDQDKDIVTTALRETEEEIGVSINDVKVIGTLSDLYIPPSQYKITPTVGYIAHEPEFDIDTREVKELFIAELDHIIHPQFRKKKNLLVRGNYRLDTPYFDIQNKVVWGATAMILSEFSKVVEDVNQMP